MSLVTAYFDASGSPDGEPYLVLGGLVSTVGKWISFTEEWNKVLQSFDVSALHMKHFAHSEGEFFSWRWNEPKRIRFIAGLITVIEQYVEYSVASALSMADYKTVDKKYRLSEFMRPYSFAASTSSGAIPAWARDSGYSPDGITHVFEKGDADQSDLTRCWKREFPELRISPLFCKKSDSYPDPNVSQPIRPFEAADLIAYENFKGNVLLRGRPKESPVYLDELRKPLQRLLQNVRGAKQWLYSEQPQIEAVCSMYNISLR